MMYLLLLIAVGVLALTAYLLFKKDILSPSFLLCLVFFASVASAWLAKIFGLWNDVELGDLVFWIISCGLLSTIVGEWVLRKWISLRNKKKNLTKEHSLKTKVIKISKLKLAAVYVLLITTLVIVVLEMMRITGISDDIPRMINEYRNLTPIFSAENAISISTFAMQLVRIANVMGIIFLFVVINNVIKKDKIKNNLAAIGIIAFSTIIMLLVGGRSSMVQYLFAGFALYIMLKRLARNNDESERKEEKWRIRRRVAAVIIVAAGLFYAIMPLIGRNQTGGMASYTTFYLGGPIPSLQKLADNDMLTPSKTFGQDSLKSIQRMLNKIGLDSEYEIYQGAWVKFRSDTGGVLASNVFTGMKPYYVDWGMIGVIVCQFMFGLVYALIYIKTRDEGSKVLYLVYALTFVNIFDQVRAEQLFGLFSISTMLCIVYGYIAVKLIIPGEKIMLLSKK